jgi:hypothetical protein
MAISIFLFDDLPKSLTFTLKSGSMLSAEMPYSWKRARDALASSLLVVFGDWLVRDVLAVLTRVWGGEKISYRSSGASFIAFARLRSITPSRSSSSMSHLRQAVSMACFISWASSILP